MGTDDQQTGGGDLPKLTIGQRLLTALPRVGGSPGATSSAEPETPSPAPADTRRDRGKSTPKKAANQEDDSAGDAVDEATDTDTEDAGDGERRPARAGPGDSATPAARSSTVRGKAGGRAPSGMTKEELVVAIKQVDDRERRYGMYLAPVGAVLGIILAVYELHTNPAAGHKHHLSSSTILWVAVAPILLSVVVFLAAMSRRRSFLGFSLLFLGLTLTSFGAIFALPFWFVGGWIVFRAFKWQKELAAMGGGKGRAAAGSRVAPDRRDPKARGRVGATERTSKKKKQPTAKGPEPSKRYTPPKPTRPKPPPAS